MTYDEWERDIPAAMKRDVIWRVQAYRLAAFLGACARLDTGQLRRDAQLRDHESIDQLRRASASVAAAIAEGYPNASLKERVRYYRYALNSLAESKAWYLDVRASLDGRVVDDRFALMESLHRLLRTMIRNPGGKKPES